MTSPRTWEQVMDEANTVRAAYAQLVDVITTRTALGEGHGPTARAARRQAEFLAQRHAVLVEEAAHGFNTAHATIPVTRQEPS